MRDVVLAEEGVYGCENMKSGICMWILGAGFFLCQNI